MGGGDHIKIIKIFKFKYFRIKKHFVIQDLRSHVREKFEGAQGLMPTHKEFIEINSVFSAFGWNILDYSLEDDPATRDLQCLN